MAGYQLVSDYKHIEKYKESFNDLAKMVFEIDFKKWYEKGYWNKDYICYSYLDGDKVIANASITKMTVVSNGKEYKAIQIGTVMTHPDYRNQGLSGKLMEYIIENYEKETDFIYLFANETVLDFYPKFGFEKVQESSFSLDVSDVKKELAKPTILRKLETDNIKDLQMIERFAAERLPVSSILGVKNSGDLLMFYFILAFNDEIYYIEEEDVIVIFKHEDAQIHIFDIISTKKVEIDKVLNHIISVESKVINFYFTPDYDDVNIHTEFITESDDTLFVRPLLKDGIKNILFPLTSHT